MLTIPSPNYRRGRLRPVRLIVLHTAQTPCAAGRAEGIARYLAGDAVDASCHYAVDPDTTVAQVAEQDTAWATPDANADGLQIEQAGYAEFGQSTPIPDANRAARQAYGTRWPTWNDTLPQRMLRTQTIPLVADLCRRWHLPPVLLEPTDILNNRSGITDHVRCSRAYGGDHWDCGHHYPLRFVVDEVARRLAGQPPADTPEDTDKMTRLIRNAEDGALYWWDGHTRAPVATNGDPWPTVEARLRSLVALHPSASQWPAGTVGPDPVLWLDLEPWDISAIPVA